MCDRRRPSQRRSPSSASTATSFPDDSTNASGPTNSSRTSIDDTCTPTDAVPISPLSKRHRKTFLPRTPARQQSLREAEAYRERKKAERDRRISARGRAYKEVLNVEEDSLRLQQLLLMKLATMENEAALCPPDRVLRVSEGELRRQRREHTEALRTSLRFPS